MKKIELVKEKIILAKEESEERMLKASVPYQYGVMIGGLVFDLTVVVVVLFILSKILDFIF
jgi:hypothetical protein